MALFELPRLALELVFAGLEAEDRRPLPLVCRASHQVCLHHPALSERLTVRPAALAALPASWRALSPPVAATQPSSRCKARAAPSATRSRWSCCPSSHTRAPSPSMDAWLTACCACCLSAACLPALRQLELRGYRIHIWDDGEEEASSSYTYNGFTPSLEIPARGYEISWDGLIVIGHDMDSMPLCVLSRLASRLDSLTLLAPCLEPGPVGELLAPLTGLTELRLAGLAGEEWGDEEDAQRWDVLASLTNLRRLTLEARLGRNSDEEGSELRCCAADGSDDGSSLPLPLASLSHLSYLSLVGSNRPSAALGQPRVWDLAGSERNDGQLSAELVVQGVSQLPALRELCLEGSMEEAPKDLWHATGLTRLLLRNTFNPTSVGKGDGEGSNMDGASLPPLPPAGLLMPRLRELCLCGTTMPAGLLPGLTGLTQLTALAVCNVDWEYNGNDQLSALGRLTDLQELDLSGSGVHEGALAPLTVLRVLRLDTCNLVSLPPHGPYASLEVLTLANNDIEECPANFLLTACPRLHTLDLSDNDELPYTRAMLALAGRSRGTRLRALYIGPDSVACWAYPCTEFRWDKNDDKLVCWLKSDCDPEERAVLDGLLELWRAGELRLGLGCGYAYDAAWPWRALPVTGSVGHSAVGYEALERLWQLFLKPSQTWVVLNVVNFLYCETHAQASS